MKLSVLLSLLFCSQILALCPKTYETDTRVLSGVVRSSFFELSPTFQHFSQWSFTQNVHNKPVVRNITLVNDDSCDPFVFQTTITEIELNTTSGYTLSLASRFNYFSSGSISITSKDKVFVFIDSLLVMNLNDSIGHLALNTLGLWPGNSYQMEVIFTGKQALELANISITTNLFFVCPFYDHCGVCEGDGSSCCNCTAPDLCHTATCTADGCLIKPVSYAPLDMCTTITCDPLTGRNITKPVICHPSDMCQTAKCDPLAGCVYGTVDCNDNDPCTIDSCSPNIGCQHTPIPNCACQGVQCLGSVEDWCHPYECDLNTKKCVLINRSCEDNNPFTMDFCNGLINECEHIRVSCDDGNNCTVDGYDGKTGKCTHTNITCDDGNLCTSKYCDPALGCVSTPIPLPRSDMCTTYICDPKKGVIVMETPCPSACSVCDPLLGCTNCTFVSAVSNNTNTANTTKTVNAASTTSNTSIYKIILKYWIYAVIAGGLLIVVIIVITVACVRYRKPKKILVKH